MFFVRIRAAAVRFQGPFIYLFITNFVFNYYLFSLLNITVKAVLRPKLPICDTALLVLKVPAFRPFTCIVTANEHAAMVERQSEGTRAGPAPVPLCPVSISQMDWLEIEPGSPGREAGQ
jgi:hypothetical protein